MSTNEIATATYGVAGMTCNGCVRSVTNALTRALPEVKVDVSLAAGEVTITGAHTADDVAEAVEAAGFDFSGPVA